MNYNNIDAILFDMDGTIFDSEVVHREAWKVTAKQFSQIFTDDMYLQFIGMTTPNCMLLAMEMFNQQVDLEEFSKGYYENLATLVNQGVPLKAGFLAYLTFVKKLNLPIGIVTSSPRSGVFANFSGYDFLDDFTVIVCREDVSNYKPSPEPYLSACNMLSVEPNRTLVFEDSNTGALAAINAGCFTVGIADLVPFKQDVKKLLSLQVDSFANLL